MMSEMKQPTSFRCPGTFCSGEGGAPWLSVQVKVRHPPAPPSASGDQAVLQGPGSAAVRQYSRVEATHSPGSAAGAPIQQS